jgi:uncharacterized protein YdcH (DUF465 family)
MTKPDKIESHIQSLLAKKKDIDIRIEVLYAERVNDEYINNLKKQKVKLNDEIANFKKQLSNLIGENNG